MFLWDDVFQTFYIPGSGGEEVPPELTEELEQLEAEADSFYLSLAGIL